MSFIAHANAMPRAFFVTGSDRDSRIGVLAGPYPSAVEAGRHLAPARDAARSRGLLARFLFLGIAEGPSNTPTYLGPI